MAGNRKFRIVPVKPGIDFRPYKYRKGYAGAIEAAKWYFAPGNRGYRDIFVPEVVRIEYSEDYDGDGRGHYNGRRWSVVATVRELAGQAVVYGTGALSRGVLDDD
jgi:hypothetical protein